MLQSVGFTLFTRLTGALLNFLSLVLLSRMLGPEARGICSWYLVVIAASLVFSELVAGPAAGYLLRSYSASVVRKVAYIWAIVPVLLVNSFFLYWGKISVGEYWLLLILCWLNAANTLQLHLLLARQKIVAFNMLSLLGPALTLVMIFIFTRSQNPASITYLYALVCSWVLVFIASLIITKQTGRHEKADAPIGQVIRDGFKYGLHNQAGHLASLLQNRLIYFLLPASLLGVYSNAISLGEALLMLPGSIGQMLYARVLNEKEQSRAAGTVAAGWWLSLVLMFLATLFVFIIPDQLYQWIFGGNFSGVKNFLVILVPGLLFYAGYLVMSYWQSANGRFINNFYAVASGLTVSAIICLVLWQTNRLSPVSCAWATSVGWLVIFIVSTWQFLLGRQASGRLFPPPGMAYVRSVLKR
jgi:O-antigen/teichoic acid export membrane protein